MSDFMEAYKKWLEDPYFDEETRAELEAIKDDTKEIEDRFYRSLEFGTGGLRGVIGAGTNRMNIFVVRKVTQGLCDYLKTSGDPLSKIMRHELRKRGVKKLKVVSSAEKPIKPLISLEELEKSNPDRDPDEPVRRSIPASSPFVPLAAGLLIASKVVMDLINWQPQK